MQKITPFLWLDHQAEEAARFYTSVFKNANVIHVSRYGDAGPGPKGSVLTVTFEIERQRFIALNGGPKFAFTPAVSFMVNCETQQEVDEYWTKLSAGGKTERCGWLRDKYGLSWQIIPTILPKLIGGDDPVKARRATEEMLQMDKIDIARLQAAYNGG